MTKAFLEINPRYRPALEEQGLAEIHRLLHLPAPIVSGHPNRNVSRVTLGAGPVAIPAFLKREHRVPWKDRLANAWAGFGIVSRSQREYRVLLALQAAGIGCADPIAAGEDGQGRAFVIVRALAGVRDLRVFLHERKGTSAYHRYRFSRRLGEALARIHDAGFDHPDLYAKHVLVDPVSEAIRFLDWQRSRQHPQLGWHQRWAGLAALEATLADELASIKERLLCLRAYLRASAQIFVPRVFLAQAADQIHRRSEKLRRRRRIREQRHPPVAAGAQDLIWLDGEALVVTRAFLEECQGRLPGWLTEPGTWPGPGEIARISTLSLPGRRRVMLTRRRTSRPWLWLWQTLRGHRLEAPEQMEAACLFRLQRFGVRTPRLLALGQRHSRPWRTESFLLTEHPPGAEPLTAWLRRQSRESLWSAERKQRRGLIREAGDVLRRIHDAGYRGMGFTDRFFLVQPAKSWGGAPSVVLGTLDGIDCRRGTSNPRTHHDLADLQRLFSSVRMSRTDKLRFLRAYLGLTRLTAAAKRLAQALAPNEEKRADGRRARPLPMTEARPRPVLSGYGRAVS